MDVFSFDILFVISLNNTHTSIQTPFSETKKEGVEYIYIYVCMYVYIR